MIFETHAHYDDSAYDMDRDQVITSIFENGIESAINISSDLKSVDRSMDLAKRYKHMYCALGIHPTETASLTEDSLARIKRDCNYEKVVAVGEIGLDYHWDTPDRNIQKKWFERQIIMAQDLDLPMIIHSRDAAEDTINMLRSLHGEETGGVIHCYSYSREMAAQFIRMDFHFGIGGVITYKNAKKLKEAVAYIPIERILLETDCPYLAPEPHRGERNDSTYITYISKEIAQIKNMEYEDVIKITRKNARRLFRIF